MRTRGLARAPGRISPALPRRPAPEGPSSVEDLGSLEELGSLKEPGSLSLSLSLSLDGSEADARLRELECRRAGLRPLLGKLAAEFLDRRAHEALGFRCVADWSRERLGVGSRSFREWARVARGLAELPRLREAVEAGEVSWTVARTILPLVTPENEAACLESVRGRTVRAVEALVRAVRGSDLDADPDDDAGAERVRVTIPCTRAESSRWAEAVELARRVAGEQLPVWACAEAIAAEAVSAAPAPSPEPTQGGPTPEACSETAPESGLRARAWPGLSWPSAPARAPGDPLTRLASGLALAPPLELDRRLRAAVAHLQSLDLELGRVLRWVLDRHLHRELGFPDFDLYARERLALSARTARRLVRLARAEHRRPGVATAFRDGAITLLQAEALLRGSASLELAKRVTLRRLEDDVEREPVGAIVFWAPPEVAELFVALVKHLGLHALLDHAIGTWLREGEQFRDYADFERDGWRCTVPGCTARRNLHSHHIRFRSAGGADAPWNRTTLCAAHHERGVHRDGRVRIWGRAPGDLVFALGVGRFASGDVKLGP